MVEALRPRSFQEGSRENRRRPGKKNQENRELSATLLSATLEFFKVGFSTFWYKFGATLPRQAERRDTGTRQKASNLAQPIS